MTPQQRLAERLVELRGQLREVLTLTAIAKQKGDLEQAAKLQDLALEIAQEINGIELEIKRHK